MTRDEALAFLATQGAGVLSLTGDPPCSLPMSFAVDQSTDRVVVQVLSGPDSAKTEFLADGVGASLVAFERSTPDDWVSAVARGELVAVERTPERVAAFADHAKSVGMEVFDSDPRDLDGTWYELRPESVTGRCGPDWDEGNTFGETR
ncbi:pyridoxamine 5'-phosphate oxidase family protein [Halobacterium jilantaiense]|nr:pyridoxamine 5'-phosphate oxidase family protein [Halobacterium jilantaiense]